MSVWSFVAQSEYLTVHIGEKAQPCEINPPPPPPDI